ncbi:hypothetical protein EFK52_13445 [Lactococcus lactis subsp. lactis]|nr:hypothetical protein [Lactococcus lactis subsp. lactis]
MCYNIVGMFVRLHPIPRVKPFFGVAFLFYIIADLNNSWYYAVCEFAPDIFVGRKICYFRVNL